jgi:hypothetical protein
MRDERDVAVAGDLVGEIPRRRFPPINLAAGERRLGRERIEGQPFDAIEMHNFRPGGEAERAAGAAGVARPIFGEAGEDRAGAADMLAGDEAIGTAADDFLDRLIR